MDDHNFFCALLCSACSTTCCCIAVWTVESNSDFLRPICRNRLCLSGLGISRQTGFNLEFPSPRWIACQGYELHPPLRSARTCYNHNNCQEVAQSKGLPGSGKIKRTARQCCNQKDCQGMLQSKGLQGMPQLIELPQSKGLPGNGTIKRTAREWHYQKVVLQ